MIGAEIVNNLLAMGARQPFDELTESELLLIARHVHRRSYAPGELMLPGGTIAEWLVVVVEGAARTGGHKAPAVFDAPSALFGLPVKTDYLAGPEGAEALCLSKPHLFTLARECPCFIVGLASLSGRNAS